MMMRNLKKGLCRLCATSLALLTTQVVLAGSYNYTNVYAHVESVPTGAADVYLIGGDPNDGNTMDPYETMPSVPGPYSEIMYTTRNSGSYTYTDKSGKQVTVDRYWLTVQLDEADEYEQNGYVFKGLTDVYRANGAYEDLDFYTGLELKDENNNTVSSNPLIRDTVNTDDEGTMTFTININKAGTLKGLATVADYKDNDSETADEQARNAARDKGGFDQPIVVCAVYVKSKSTGINDIRADKTADPDAPIYNAAGQRVGKSYKGLVIKNGKKYVQR